MAYAEGTVGLIYAADGSLLSSRFDRSRALVTQDAHGRYAEAVRRGNVFVAHNVAAQAVSVALATTYTGLVLANPLGSAKNLEILAAGFALTVAPAAIASLHLIGGNSVSTDVVHTTPVTPTNALVGSVLAPVGKVDSAATIPTPKYLVPLNSGFTAAALPSSPNVWVPIEGLIVVGPGGFVALGALTAVTGFGGIAWEEVQI